MANRTTAIESFFAKLGLVSACLFAMGTILMVDIWLGPHGKQSPELPALALHLQTHDGRPVGDSTYGIPLRLSPRTFYQNRESASFGQYRTNSLGLRGSEIRPEENHVLVLGGSAAFGLSVAEDKTFVSLLNDRLVNWSVLNAGTVGFVSEQELAWTFFELAKIDPKLVIDFTGWNDIYSAYWLARVRPRSPENYTSNPNFLVLEDRLAHLRELESQPRRLWSKAWQLGLEHSWILGSANALLGDADSTETPHDLGDFDATLEAISHDFVDNMVRLRSMVEATGGNFLVVLQPEVGGHLGEDNLQWLRQHQPDYLPGDRYWQDFPGLYRKFRELVGARFAAEDITWIDANEEFAKRRVGSRLFLDPVHLNESGHLLIAEIISNSSSVDELERSKGS